MLIINLLIFKINEFYTMIKKGKGVGKIRGEYKTLTKWRKFY